MRKFVFIKNALILTVTAFILRACGMCFRVYLSNSIGAEGMGLYQLIFSVYFLGASFATSGITMAVTRIISETADGSSRKRIKHIMNRVYLFALLAGLCAMAVMYFGAYYISVYWLKDMRGVVSLKILSLSLPFMSVSSALKGYFIARRKVAVSSRAQIFEQIVRIALSVWLLGKFLPNGTEMACRAVFIGNMVSEGASVAYLMSGYYIDRKNLNKADPVTRSGSVIRKLIKIAVPVAGGSYINSILHTVENVMVPDKLAFFTNSKERALSQFGMVKGMVLPVIMFPSSFLGSLATLLVPEISSAEALGAVKRRNRTLEVSMYIALAGSIMMGAVFLLFGDLIGNVIYKDDGCGYFIKMLGIAVPFMYTENIVFGIMQGMDLQNSVFKVGAIDSVIRIVMIMLIVPHFGINGYMYVVLVSNIFTCYLNTRKLFASCNVKFLTVKWVIKPVFASAVASVICRWLATTGLVAQATDLVKLLVVLPLFATVYVAVMYLLGELRHRDFKI